MEYDGRGKVQILQKIIKIECEITHRNRLRLAFKMTKTQKLPGAPPPGPPPGPIGRAPGPHSLIRGI